MKSAPFLEPLLARVTAGVDAVAAAARSGVLRVDDELHLSPLPAEDEDPEVTKLRAALDHRIGEVQLPEVNLAVDAQVRRSEERRAGKSVSVRVDLGGRRINNKKNKLVTNTIETQDTHTTSTKLDTITSTKRPN